MDTAKVGRFLLRRTGALIASRSSQLRRLDQRFRSPIAANMLVNKPGICYTVSGRKRCLPSIPGPDHERIGGAIWLTRF